MEETTFDVFKSIVESLQKAFEYIAPALNAMRNWLQQNSEAILAFMAVFQDIATIHSADEIMAAKQIVFTDELTLDFAQKVCNSTDVDSLIQQYYFDDNEKNMCKLIDRCKNSKQLQNHQDYFYQIIEAYQQNSFRLSCTGLFALVDGILAEVSNIDKTPFSPRIDKIKEKFDKQIELSFAEQKIWLIYVAIDKFENTIFADSRFSNPEPDCLNRHWVMHGRTHRTYTRYDVLKVLLWLDAIIFLDNMNTELEEINSVNNTAAIG